jgi:hypothetical protein
MPGLSRSRTAAGGFAAAAVAGLMTLMIGCAAADDSTPPPGPTQTPSPPQAQPGTQPPNDGPWGEFDSWTDCEVYVPFELPSGADPGSAQVAPAERPQEFYVAWGTGPDQVTVGYGREFLEDMEVEEFPRENFPQQLIVAKDGVERYVVSIGEGGAPITIWFVTADCPYILWMSGVERDGDGEVIFPGYTIEEGLDYAGRF